MSIIRWLAFVIAVGVCVHETELQAQVRKSELQLPDAVQRPVDFIADVQPIFETHCYECHSGDTEEGGLNLAIKEKAMAGSAHGPVIVPQKSRASSLVQLVSGVDEDRLMPPDDNVPLSTMQIGILRAWIDQGADWPQKANVLDPRSARAKGHWAFQRLRRVNVPDEIGNDSWSQTKIDRFVLKKLVENKLSPSRTASAHVLMRRIYFDLIGLPPTPDQTDQFAASFPRNPREAMTELIDTLLCSQHYGERWARHWLDVARYADSDGQESDRDRPFAYHYRDFVISAFNEDMPYDQFVRWQIAGDEYEPEHDAAVSATGFLTAGPSMKLKDTFLERERLFNRYNELDDIVSTVGTGLLGLTVGCARCHDHKYDAFSSREYYQLLRVFHSGDRVNGDLPNGGKGFFFKDFDATARTTWLFRRSDFYDREIEVDLGFPKMLSAGPDGEDYWTKAKNSVDSPESTLQRRAFADWLTNVEHGGGALLARVIVNRIWQHHFGHGLVRTPGDFGVRGEHPSHPMLLEYLAHDFVENGWRIKRLQRMILRSAVWQQGSSPTNAETSTGSINPSTVDPSNRLLWKMTPRRLEAEAMRDAMLVISGTLSLEAGGPGFKPYIPPEANVARNIQGGDYPKNAPDDATTRRRSVYMFHKRLVPYPLFQAFDRPDLMTSCARRQNTTVAPQAIALLNDRFVRSVSRDFAKRLVRSSGDDERQLVEAAFQLSFCRSPNDIEMAASTSFIQAQTKNRKSRKDKNQRLEAITDFCQSLFGLNEFVYVD